MSRMRPTRSLRVAALLILSLAACDDSGRTSTPAADQGGAGGMGGAGGPADMGGMADRGGLDDMDGMGGAVDMGDPVDMDSPHDMGGGGTGGIPFEGIALAAPPNARACEAVLSAPTAITVDFGDGLRGRVLARPPRTALAVIGAEPMPPGALSLRIDGDPTALSLLTTQCFDGSGAPLADGLEIVR